MSDATPAPDGLSLADAATAARELGYTDQLIAEEGPALRHPEDDRSWSPSDVEVTHTWRIEGTSDSADQMLIAAVDLPDGDRALLVCTYGPNASIADTEVLDALDLSSAEPGPAA